MCLSPAVCQCIGLHYYYAKIHTVDEFRPIYSICTLYVKPDSNYINAVTAAQIWKANTVPHLPSCTLHREKLQSEDKLRTSGNRVVTAGTDHQCQSSLKNPTKLQQAQLPQKRQEHHLKHQLLNKSSNSSTITYYLIEMHPLTSSGSVIIQPQYSEP